MAKSFYEPKKIVRYQDSVLNPTTGLGAAGTPPLKPSATKVVPKTQAIPPAAAAVSAPAPVAAAPAIVTTPTPPAPTEETRAFSFDGATELTGSLPADFRSNLASFNVNVTFTPYWSNLETGSFAIFSIGKKDSDDSRVNVYFQRTSGSYGYSGHKNFLVGEFITGSDYFRTRWPIEKSQVFAGQSTNFHIQTHVLYGGLAQLREGRKDNRSTRIFEYTDTGKITRAATAALTEDHVMSIGGFNSGSDHYFSGSISNLIIIPSDGTYRKGSPTTVSHYSDSNIKAAYKFEGNVSASIGGIDLAVVGTETYVSASI